MAFDVESLRKAVITHGRVARVVIAEVRGSSPREVGAAMLVWDGGQSGTIGGGTLEFEAAKTALSQSQHRHLSRHALGPDMGQCCGGSVALLTEVYEAADLKTLSGDIIARAVSDGPQPLSVARILSKARNMGTQPAEQLVDGWMVEPVYRPDHPLWIWGAGHVGRALVDVLSPLPQYDITWVDTGPERFPEAIPAGVTPLPAAQPELLVPHAQSNAQHLVLTYSHQLDLASMPRPAKPRISIRGPDRIGHQMGPLSVSPQGPRPQPRTHQPYHLPYRPKGSGETPPSHCRGCRSRVATTWT